MRLLLLLITYMTIHSIQAQDLRFVDYTPKWMHEIHCNDCPESVALYYWYPYHSEGRHFIRYTDDQIIIPGNIHNVWGYNILSLDMETGEQQWQVTKRYERDSLGSRRMIDNPSIVGDTLVVPMYVENGYVHDAYKYWYKGNLGVEKFDMSTGDRLDTLVFDHSDPRVEEVENSILAKANIFGNRSAHTYYTNGKIEHIYHNFKVPVIETFDRYYIKKTFSSHGRLLSVSDTIKLHFDPWYGMENIVDVTKGSFATFAGYKNYINPENGGDYDTDYYLHIYDKDDHTLREVNTHGFLEDYASLRYMDSTQAIYYTMAENFQDTALWKFLHVVQDSIVLEESPKLGGIAFNHAVPYQDHMLIVYKDALDYADEKFFIFRSDGEGNLHKVFTLRHDKSTSDEDVYFYPKSIHVLPNNDLLLMIDYREYYGAHPADFGPHNIYAVCIPASDLSFDSVTENTPDKEVSVYPNPTSEFVSVQSSEDIQSISLYDVSGKQYAIQLLEDRVDVSALPTGTYILYIIYRDGNRLSRKIVKR